MTRNKWNQRFLRPQEGDAGDAGGGDTGHLPSGGDAIGSGNDARVALLNSIGDQYDEIRSEELSDINDDGSTSAFKVQRPDGSEEDLAERTAAEDGAAAEAARVTAEQEAHGESTAQQITRKVNGKLVTKSLEEWLVDASKVNAADEYLQDAARIRKEASRVLDTEQVPTQKPTQPEIDPQAQAAEERARRVKLARAIQMGTEEEAVAAIEELQNMARTPTLSVEDVGRVTDERMTFNTAINDFNREFSDLVSNPQLHAMVKQADAALIAKGDKRPYAERYTEIGNAVRSWRDDLVKSVTPTAAPTPTAPTDDLATRRAAKAAAPKVPQSAGKVAAAPAEEDNEEDVSSVIANMRKSRGGPEWMQGR